MGPTRVDPLAHARLIVRQYRDAHPESEAAEGTHLAVASPAFGRRDGVPAEASSEAPGQLTPRVRVTMIFVLSCIIIVALVSSLTLSWHY